VATAFRAAAEAGLKPGEFWQLTPYETRIWIDGQSKAERRRYRLALWSAWHVEAFRRRRRLPRLALYLRRLDPQPIRPQSPEQVLKTLERLNARFGGRDIRPAKS
jgi:hypothetical protein